MQHSEMVFASLLFDGIKKQEDNTAPPPAKYNLDADPMAVLSWRWQNDCPHLIAIGVKGEPDLSVTEIVASHCKDYVINLC